MENNIHWDFQSFYSEKGWKHLYSTGNAFLKFNAVLGGFCRRVLLLTRLHKYQSIIIHRELTPFGPPIFEWVISKVYKKKIIYDFDDAIWMNDGHDSGFMWKLKWRSKIASTCKWSWKVTAGNDFLANYARQYCNQVILFPTVVDTDIHLQAERNTLDAERWTLNAGRQALNTELNTQFPIPNTESLIPNVQSAASQKPKAKDQRPVVGWTGSHSTLFYLDMLLPILQQLEKELDFEFLVIANKDPKLHLKHYRFIPWNKNSEVEDLRQIDIGVMPLEDNEWSKGKCGFKLIQYLSIGIPAIASPVGVNTDIIIPGKTGFLASSETEWFENLTKLIQDPQLRNQLGQNGRKLIEEKYSVDSLRDKFIQLFEEK